MPVVHLTRRTIDAIPLADTGQTLYRDRELRGFGLRVGSRSKVFFVEGQVAHRTVRVTVGPYGPLAPDVARRLALQHLSTMAQGQHPRAERRQSEWRRLTVQEAFERFFAARTTLSPRSVSSYGRTLRLYVANWANRPLSEITRGMVLARHRQLSESAGGTTANSAMRHFRSVYNTAAASHDELPPNPVSILTQARAWQPEKRRQRLVSAQGLPGWWAATMTEPPLSRDFLLVALFTGMRRREISGLRWENVDLRARTLEVPRTKNGDPLTLPLSTFLTQLLRERRLLVGASPFVFPTRSRSGHLEEVKSFVGRVAERSGIGFSAHDLRRTFITVAESLDVPAYTLKRLLNHRLGSDVTGGYIVIGVDRLRVPVEAIASRLLELANAASDRCHLVALSDEAA